MMLVDTSMVMHRCFHKMDFLKNSEGIPTGLEFGSLKILQMLKKNYPDQQIVCCFDCPPSENWRRKESKVYKSDRKEASEGFFERVTEFKKFLRCIYYTSELHEEEADDVIYALSRKYKGPHYIYTNDKDLLQAVSNEFGIIQLKSWKSNLYEWTEDKVLAEFGVSPEVLPFLRAFIGDKSDNLTGVSRIGKSYLAELIQWCHKKGLDFDKTLEEIKTGDWSESEKTKITEFIDSGAFYENYKLMVLLAQNAVEVHLPVENDDFVVECLNKWEILSLEICEKYKDKLVASLDEEF